MEVQARLCVESCIHRLLVQENKVKFCWYSPQVSRFQDQGRGLWVRISHWAMVEGHRTVCFGLSLRQSGSDFCAGVTLLCPDNQALLVNVNMDCSYQCLCASNPVIGLSKQYNRIEAASLRSQPPFPYSLSAHLPSVYLVCILFFIFPVAYCHSLFKPCWSQWNLLKDQICCLIFLHHLPARNVRPYTCYFPLGCTLGQLDFHFSLWLYLTII